MKHILFGGAFDPIHSGHLNMALKASESLSADVLFIISRVSVWKERSAPINHKIEMLKKAIAPYENFKINLVEVNSGKKVNYTIDTIKYFINRYPKDQFYLLIGADQVEEFHRWKQANEICNLVQIIYFARPNHESTSENIEKYHMLEIKGDTVDVTSSKIRRLQSLNTPFPVVKYIEENELYYMQLIKGWLTDHRYRHCISVANLSYEIALANNIENPIRAYAAGLLHDCGKYQCDPIVDEGIAVKGYQDIDNPALIHQFVGAEVAKDIFRITDEEIIEAIKFHATGKANMTDIAKIVFVADKTDPLRGYDSSEQIEMTKNDLNKGFLSVLNEQKSYLKKKGYKVDNRLTKECYDFYLND